LSERLAAKPVRAALEAVACGDLSGHHSFQSASVGVRICDMGILKTNILNERIVLSDLQCVA